MAKKTVKKSKAASDVLKLMDKDYSYREAVKIVLGLNSKLSKDRLETELNKYV